MLAQLLRSLILSQALVGFGIGYYLESQGMGSLAWAVVFAIGLPFLVLACSNLYSGYLSRPTGSWVMWCKAVLGEFIASTRIFLLYQPWGFRPPAFLPAQQNKGKVPVILVHGYLCNHLIWHDVIKELQDADHNIMPVDLEPLFTSIDDYAAILEAAVLKACQETSSNKVILVGHSMGGIAIRAWMRRHGADRVAGVITLGSPHQGTKLSRGALGPNAKQMAWRSPWLKSLAASETDAVRRLFKIAITPQDNIVYPQKVQLLPGTEAQIFEGIGHLQMCLHRPVIEWLIQQVQDIQQKETRQ